jgi:hypothetical protein
MSYAELCSIIEPVGLPCVPFCPGLGLMLVSYMPLAALLGLVCGAGLAGTVFSQ